jgi:hypothetical protein
MPNTQHSANLDRITFANRITLLAGPKTPERIRHELLALFDAGLGRDESIAMVVPKLSNLKWAFHAEWESWEAARRVRNTAVMCGNG